MDLRLIPQRCATIAEHTEADLSSAIDDYRKGQGQPGGTIRAGYALWTLDATGWKADETTAAVAHYLSVASSNRDHVHISANRPPSEFSDFTATALTLRGLRAFSPSKSAPTTKDGARTKSLDQLPSATEVPWREPVLKWLKRAKPRDTEDRVFRLWGLKFAGASAEELASAARALLKSQRPDGGWSQLDAPESPKGKGDKGAGATARDIPASALLSDAYATGSVLVALSLPGGLDPDNPGYRRGLEFLVQTQRDDGSWFVKSRSRPFQTYFESGFPHGPDQFISAAASAWAVAALESCGARTLTGLTGQDAHCDVGLWTAGLCTPHDARPPHSSEDLWETDRGRTERHLRPAPGHLGWPQ